MMKVGLPVVTAACAVSMAGGVASASSQVKKVSPSVLVARAKAEILKYTAVPKFTLTGPKLDAAKLGGKTVLVVLHDAVSDDLVAIQNGIEQAGKAAGLHIESYNGGGVVSAIEAGVEQGINQHVGAIILDGPATSLIPSALKLAASAHIPVIGAIIGQPTKGASGQGAGDNIFGMSGPSYVESGRLMADTAIVDSQGKNIDGVIERFDNPISPATIMGMVEVFRSCSSCHILSSQDIEPPAWPTTLAGETSSLLRAHPKVNYVFTVTDTMGLFATSGVAQSGASRTVKVIAADGSSAGPLSLIQKGSPFVADPGSSAVWTGWSAVDQAMRAMSHVAPGNPTVPNRYLDKADLAGVNLKQPSLTTVYGDSYVAGFEKEWGLIK